MSIKNLQKSYCQTTVAQKGGGHTPHNLGAAFAMHQTFQQTGDMAQTDFAKFV